MDQMNEIQPDNGGEWGMDGGQYGNQQNADNGNKRSADQTDGADDTQAPTKRARHDDAAIRFLIPSRHAGAIIGKGGSNINRLRNDFNASVSVPDCSGPERILSVEASIETIGQLLLDIIPRLDDYSHNKDMSFKCEIRMLVHQNHAGSLIGRAGYRIKELRERTGAVIKIFSECCPMSTDRVVLISGQPDIVTNCVKDICENIMNAPLKFPCNNYNPRNFDIDFATEYGGFEGVDGYGRGGRGGRFGGGGGGAGGRGGRNRGGGGGGRVQWNRGGYDDYDDGGWNDYDDGDMMRGRAGGGGFGGGYGGGRGGRDGRRMGRGGGRNGGMYDRQDGDGPQIQGNMQQTFSDNYRNQGGSGSSHQFSVKKDIAGAIIGRGGLRIKRIRQDSGATINIAEAIAGADERVITISGTDFQMDKARFMLQDCVRKNAAPGSQLNF